MIELIASIIVLGFVALAGFVVYRRIKTVTNMPEPDALRIAYDKKWIAEMEPIEVKNVLVIGQGNINSQD